MVEIVSNMAFYMFLAILGFIAVKAVFHIIFALLKTYTRIGRIVGAPEKNKEAEEKNGEKKEGGRK